MAGPYCISEQTTKYPTRPNAKPGATSRGATLDTDSHWIGRTAPAPGRAYLPRSADTNPGSARSRFRLHWTRTTASSTPPTRGSSAGPRSTGAGGRTPSGYSTPTSGGSMTKSRAQVTDRLVRPAGPARSGVWHPVVRSRQSGAMDRRIRCRVWGGRRTAADPKAIEEWRADKTEWLKDRSAAYQPCARGPDRIQLVAAAAPGPPGEEFTLSHYNLPEPKEVPTTTGLGPGGAGRGVSIAPVPPAAPPMDGSEPEEPSLLADLIEAAGVGVWPWLTAGSILVAAASLYLRYRRRASASEP